MLKNWYRLFYVLFCAAAAVMYVSLFALKPSGETIGFHLLAFLLAPLVFFVGTIVYNILKCFKKTDVAASYTQLATGLLATILLSIGARALYGEAGLAEIVSGIRDTIDGTPTPSPDMAAWYAQILVTFAFFGQLVVFGLMPFLKGISKVFAVTPQLECPKCEEPMQPGTKTRKPRTPRAQTTPAFDATVALEPKPARKPRTPKPKPTDDDVLNW